MILFSGTSNVPLSEAVASALGVSLGKVEITRFIDNECRVFVKDDVAGQEVFVLQSLSIVADQHLIELCLLGQALKDLGAKRVTAVIPWLGYSKQDKAFRKGEAISAHLVAKFIEAAGFDAVITTELHSENVLQFFHIPVVEISTHTFLADTLRRKSSPPATRGEALRAGLSLENVIVVSPDKGGKSRSDRFAKEVGLDIAYLEKSRDRQTGAVNITGIEGTVTGKDVVIFDDIINTGATALKTSEFVKRKGAASVYFLATHAVLAGSASIDLSRSVIDEVIVTDTISVSDDKRFDKLFIASVSSLLADAIRKQTK